MLSAAPKIFQSKASVWMRKLISDEKKTETEAEELSSS
jgi:hypothetical protein